GLLVLLCIGLIIAVLAELVLLGRIDNSTDQTQAIFEAMATFVLVVGPLAFGVWTLARYARAPDTKRVGTTVLLAFGVLLALFTVRSSVMLSFYNARTSNE